MDLLTTVDWRFYKKKKIRLDVAKPSRNLTVPIDSTHVPLLISVLRLRLECAILEQQRRFRHGLCRVVLRVVLQDGGRELCELVSSTEIPTRRRRILRAVGLRRVPTTDLPDRRLK